MNDLLGTALGAHWRDPRHPDFWAVLTAMLGTVYPLVFLSRDLAWFISMFPADDFFYYMNTAYHVAEGMGSSVDGGLTHHNGFHPLFLLLLLPGFMLGVGKVGMIYVGMGILVASWTTAILLAYRLGRGLGATWAALAVPVIMAFNVELIRTTLSGFETALSTALVLAVLLALLQRRTAWQVGVLLGLAGLARIDNGLLALPVALSFAAQRRWRDLVVTAAISAIMMSPWVLWSTIEFGSPLPLSGVVKSWASSSQEWWRGALVFGRESTYRLLGYSWRDVVPRDLAIAISGLVLFAVAVRRGCPRWLTLYAMGAPVFYAIMTGSEPHLPQFNRYCVPAFLVLATLLLARPGPRFSWITGLLAVSVGMGSVQYTQWSLRTPPLRNYVGLCQRELPAVIEKITAPGDRIGSRNSGALGYFSQRTVVNLDGLVNADIVRRFESDRGATWNEIYGRYMNDMDIHLFVDGTSFAWPRNLTDALEWSERHAPIDLQDGSQIVFLEVPTSARGSAER